MPIPRNWEITFIKSSTNPTNALQSRLLFSDAFMSFHSTESRNCFQNVTSYVNNTQKLSLSLE